MKSIKASPEAIARNIAVILKHNPEKVAQVEKAQAITIWLTSDDWCTIDCEMYDDGIERYIIRGTRATVTVTAKEPEHLLTRKPRGARPWYEERVECWMHDILSIYTEITKY